MLVKVMSAQMTLDAMDFFGAKKPRRFKAFDEMRVGKPQLQGLTKNVMQKSAIWGHCSVALLEILPKTNVLVNFLPNSLNNPR